MGFRPGEQERDDDALEADEGGEEGVAAANVEDDGGEQGVVLGEREEADGEGQGLVGVREEIKKGGKDGGTDEELLEVGAAVEAGQHARSSEHCGPACRGEHAQGYAGQPA